MADPSDRNYWSPKNYSGSGGGVTTLRRALEHSKNLVTANLLDGAIEASPEASLRARLRAHARSAHLQGLRAVLSVRARRPAGAR